MFRYILLLLIVATNVYAEGVFITGKLLDSTSKTPLISANVRLVSADSSIKLLKETNKKGEFEFQDIEKGKYSIFITYIGYLPYNKLITVSDNDINLGNIKLVQTAIQLDEVVVTANHVLIEQNKDTINFNASACKTKPGATLEDLLKKLPGFDVDKDGNITYNGKPIRSIYIDGKPFLMDNPQAVLQNLPAHLIDKIKVYGKVEDKEEFMGSLDAQKNKVINIETKDKSQKIQFGQIHTGYSYSDKYKLSSSYNSFDSSSRLSIEAYSTNFSPSSNSQYLYHQIMGNYMINSNKIENSTFFCIDYSLNNSNSSIDREYLQQSSKAKYYNYNSNSHSDDVSFLFLNSCDYNIDSSNKFNIRSSLNYRNENSQSNTNSYNYTVTHSLLNSSIQEDNNHNNLFSVSNEIMFKHIFKNNKRTLACDFDMNYSNNNQPSNRQINNTYNDTVSSTFSNNKQDNNSKVNYYMLSSVLNYIEPVNESTLLNLSYEVIYTKDNNNNSVNALDTTTRLYYFDSLQSNIFESYNFKQKIKFAFSTKFNENKLSLNAGLNFSRIEIYNKSIFPINSLYDDKYFTFLPTCSIVNNFSETNSLSLNYYTSAYLPDFTQLENRLNTDNLMDLSKGNPDLKQSYSHELYIESSITLKENYLLSNYLSFGYTFNSITNAVNIAQADSLILPNLVLPAGGQISSPININGVWSIKLSSNLAFPIYVLNSKAYLSVYSSYSVSPRMINNLLNKSKNYSIGPQFSISSSLDSSLDFSFNTRANYSVMENSYSNNTQTISNRYDNSIRIKWTFWKSMFIELSYDNQISIGSINNSIDLLDFNLGTKLFNNNKGEIKLSINDILNNNKALENNITDYYIETAHKSIIRRYFLLEFSYQIGNMM